MSRFVISFQPLVNRFLGIAIPYMPRPSDSFDLQRSYTLQLGRSVVSLDASWHFFVIRTASFSGWQTDNPTEIFLMHYLPLHNILYVVLPKVIKIFHTIDSEVAQWHVLFNRLIYISLAETTYR